eukprot:sb/3477218/
MTQGKWVFDKKQLRQTPSQADGIDYLTELRYRKEEDPPHPPNPYISRWVMAAACFFLAGKVEETPKLSKDIVRTAKNLLSSDQFKGFGLSPVDEMLLYEKMLLQVFSTLV